MAENEGTTKVEEQTKPAEGAETSEENSEDMLSLENLDSLIAEEDPEFAQSLENIGPDEAGGVEIYNEGLGLEYTLEDEVKLWTGAPGRRQKFAKIFPFLPKISYKLKMKRTVLRLTWTKWRESLIRGIKSAGPATVAGLKNLLKKISGGISKGLGEFKTFSLVKKLLFVGLLAATGGSVYVIYRVATHKLLPEEHELFMSSLEDWAQAKYQIEPEEQMESFYDSTRTAQNIMELKKMVVNIRRSSSSGSNPMAAFEFYVEGTVSEAVVEIKDREPEVRDLFQRTIEETTYDQIVTGEGKRLLCDRLRKDVNKLLTKGKIRRVFIKTAIIKP